MTVAAPDIIDADSHVLEPPDLWDTYLEAEWRGRSITIARDDDGHESLLIDNATVLKDFLGSLGGVEIERERLSHPGEVSYLVIDDRPPAAKTADTPVSSKLQKTKTDWVHSLFGSFMGAGLTEATPQQLSGTPAPTPTPTSSTPGGSR